MRPPAPPSVYPCAASGAPSAVGEPTRGTALREEGVPPSRRAPEGGKGAAGAAEGGRGAARGKECVAVEEAAVQHQWVDAAFERSASAATAPPDANRARLLKLHNIQQARVGGVVSEKLFKLLMRFGEVEYCRFETEETDTFDQGAQMLSCYAQTKGKAAQSFSVDHDPLLPPSCSVVAQSSADAAPRWRGKGGARRTGLAEVFSFFSTSPPTVLHEPRDVGYERVVITFERCEDAAAALYELQRRLAEHFSIELQFIGEDGKTAFVEQARQSGGLCSLHNGGRELPLGDSIGVDQLQAIPPSA
eukprot:gene4968-65113_t